ncbi:MAG TPA: P1 family peptidase, partial [Candidatus Saccharimonadia bacterium]|nr:P1 family peptidase [Candidatus Saccharimonadia bacterium]
DARPRARDLALPIGGEPGSLDAITDVAGVEVGYATLIEGAGALKPGKGPVRTGVTLVFPRGRANLDPVFGAWHSFNGNGEMTGTAWLEEGGFLEGPVAITNTHSVGVVRDAIVRWETKQGGMPQLWQLPVVAETWDGVLNDIEGMHVRESHVLAAIESARGGVVPAEGNVGGGTGMVCFEFKGGTGTASRRVTTEDGTWTVGVLVQCNTGLRADLRIAGVPVGAAFADRLLACRTNGAAAGDSLGIPTCAAEAEAADEERGSIIVVIATDAPLMPHQLERIAQRATVGLARAGGFGGNGSGDLFVAFSTANSGAAKGTPATVTALGNGQLSPLFKATALATEAAIVNALLQAEDMVGIEHRRVPALPWRELAPLFRRHGHMLTIHGEDAAASAR